MMKQCGTFLILLFIIIHENGNFYFISAENSDGFITTKGVQFMLDGIPFYANGFNAYWLMCEASYPSQRHKVSTAFQQAFVHNLKVSRTWAFSDGGDSPLQYSPGEYNEKMFQGLDFVIYEASKYGIKLILSLVNNYENLGGKKQYVAWARSQGEQISSDDDFFTNSLVKQYYKNHVKAILSRKNSISGVSYMDDPTIMGWELMNEPRCTSDTTGATLQVWIEEMASYLKSIDKKHLLEAGLEGFYGPFDARKQHNNLDFQTGTDFIANNLIPEIDLATIHSYPDQWLIGQSNEAQLSFLRDWVHNHIQDAEDVLKKPLLHAEFGKSSEDPGFNVYQRDKMFDTVYSAIFTSARGGGAAAGGLFWQLLIEGMYNYGDGYEIIFSESPTTANIVAQQSKRLHFVRQMYTMIRNIKRKKSRFFGGNSGN